MKCELLANSIVTTDLHLTDQSHGLYRWQIFPKLEKLASTGYRTVYILGDLTHEKDHHSAHFVHQLYYAVKDLAKTCEVLILKGNHDYRTGVPFFHWLNELDGVRFISDIAEDKWGQLLYLPHTRQPKHDWQDIKFGKYRCIMMHETVAGSVVSNGSRVEGIDPALGVRNCLVLSGDVHVPQQVGDVVYVGSPYHVHFGDRYQPRVLAFDENGMSKDVPLDFPQRFVLTVNSVFDLNNHLLVKGDMVKVRLRANSASMDFRTTREEIFAWAEELGVTVQGLELAKPVVRKHPPSVSRDDDTSDPRNTGRRDPSSVVREYGERNADAETIEYGLDVVRHVWA